MEKRIWLVLDTSKVSTTYLNVFGNVYKHGIKLKRYDIDMLLLKDHEEGIPPSYRYP